MLWAVLCCGRVLCCGQCLSLDSHLAEATRSKGFNSRHIGIYSSQLVIYIPHPHPLSGSSPHYPQSPYPPFTPMSSTDFQADLTLDASGDFASRDSIVLDFMAIKGQSAQENLKQGDRDLERARDLAKKKSTLIRPFDMESASDKFCLCVLLTSQSVSVTVMFNSRQSYRTQRRA